MRDRIVEFALQQVGKPYAEQGWGPNAYDCIGLFARAGIEAGVFTYDRAKEDDQRMRCYSATADPPLMLKALKKYFIRLKASEVLPGDGLWFRDPRAQHLGVVTRLSPFRVVHASMNGMRVRHQTVRNSFYVIRGWRYPGLG